VVVCQDVGVDRRMGNQFGDIMATTFQRLGVVAAVTDGGVRDVAGMQKRAPGFQMFAPGAVATGGVSVVVDVGIPVTICGLAVAPGDLLHGDANGIVNIPLELADKVVAIGQEILEAERKRVDFIIGPDFSFEELARRSGW
jgi:regulator of RNase E activity RraA